MFGALNQINTTRLLEPKGQALRSRTMQYDAQWKVFVAQSKEEQVNCQALSIYLEDLLAI